MNIYNDGIWAMYLDAKYAYQEFDGMRIHYN